MIPFPFLPIVAGLALASVPPVSPTPHPHFTRATIVAGVKGNLQVTYRTVPFNADNLKDLDPGFINNVGGAQMTTTMALTCGDVKVPAGTYRVNAQLGSDGKSWSIALTPPRGQEGDTLVLPSKAFSGAPQEHLMVSALSLGYLTETRGSTEAAEGVEGELRLSFGSMHAAAAFKEDYTAGGK